MSLGMSCPSSPGAPEPAEMSPQLDWLSGVSVSLDAFLSLYVCLSLTLFLPSYLLLSIHRPFSQSVCQPLCHRLLSADWAPSLLCRTQSRAPPGKQTSVPSSSSLQVFLGASFHKANNVMCYHSNTPTHHHPLPYSGCLVLPSSLPFVSCQTTHYNLLSTTTHTQTSALTNCKAEEDSHRTGSPEKYILLPC